MPEIFYEGWHLCLVSVARLTHSHRNASSRGLGAPWRVSNISAWLLKQWSALEKRVKRLIRLLKLFEILSSCCGCMVVRFVPVTDSTRHVLLGRTGTRQEWYTVLGLHPEWGVANVSGRILAERFYLTHFFYLLSCSFGGKDSWSSRSSYRLVLADVKKFENALLGKEGLVGELVKIIYLGRVVTELFRLRKKTISEAKCSDSISRSCLTFVSIQTGSFVWAISILCY